MIRADLYRVVRSKVIYIGLALMLLMAMVSIYTVQPGHIMVSSAAAMESYDEYENLGIGSYSYEELTEMTIKDFREIMLKSSVDYALDKDILSANMNIYYILLFLTAVAIGTDLSGSCVKNTLSSAISRRKYFISKVIFVNICAAIILFVNTYFVYYSNLILNGENLSSGFWEVTKITFLQLPAFAAIVSVQAGLAFICRKSAIFNAVTIILVMVIQIGIELLTSVFKIDEKWFKYEFQVMITKLAHSPSVDYILQSFAFCGVIVVICYLAGYLSFRKAEIA